jgi:putative oxidoreductase
MRRVSKKSLWSSTSFLQDLGLLMLRLGVGLPMLACHGMPYLTHFDQEAARFLPLFGLNASTTLVLAIVSEVGAAFLMVVGLFTRPAALLLAVNMAVAFVVVHGASFMGEQSGEPAFLYMIGAATISMMGPGRLAVDHRRAA